MGRYATLTIQVISANMYNVDLWKRSGHYKHYKDDMFAGALSCGRRG